MLAQLVLWAFEAELGHTPALTKGAAFAAEHAGTYEVGDACAHTCT